jgi:hypothetical protein
VQRFSPESSTVDVLMPGILDLLRCDGLGPPPNTLPIHRMVVRVGDKFPAVTVWTLQSPGEGKAPQPVRGCTVLAIYRTLVEDPNEGQIVSPFTPWTPSRLSGRVKGHHGALIVPLTDVCTSQLVPRLICGRLLSPSRISSMANASACLPFPALSHPAVRRFTRQAS